MGAAVVSLLRLLARWRERERHRRELATMAARDFGDTAVPPGLIQRGTSAVALASYEPRVGGACQG